MKAGYKGGKADVLVRLLSVDLRNCKRENTLLI